MRVFRPGMSTVSCASQYRISSDPSRERSDRPQKQDAQLYKLPSGARDQAVYPHFLHKVYYTLCPSRLSSIRTDNGACAGHRRGVHSSRLRRLLSHQLFCPQCGHFRRRFFVVCSASRKAENVGTNLVLHFGQV